MDIKEILKKIKEPINLHKLEEVLIEHTFLFQEATENLADLRLDYNRKKQNAESVKGELMLKIRQQYEDAGKKGTEAVFNAEVEAHPIYKGALDEYFLSKRDYDFVDGIREMFTTREASIKNLVSLYQSQYWSLTGLDRSEKSLKPTIPAADPNSAGKFKTRPKE